jgi:predicted glycosyltransferase
MTNAPTLLLYCQHSLGLGHLKRSWALAAALAAEFRVLLVSGGARPNDMHAPDGVETLELPALAQDEAGRLFSVNEDLSVDDACESRRQCLIDAYRNIRPAVVVIELFPFGRRKFAGELMPLLEETRRGPRPVVASSVRDLLVDRGAGQQKHDDRAAAILDEYFDAVLVHTDPRFSTLDETFRPSAPLGTPVYHTGFVVADASRPQHSNGRRILVSGGGGRFAEPLYTAAIEARRMLSPDAPPMTIVAGPLCPPDTVERLRAATAGDDRIGIDTTVADLADEMRHSSLSVSQCGYNTALDILRAGVPALVVPFAGNGDSEQTERAARLARLGAVRMLAANDLRPDALASAMQAAMDFVPQPVSLDFDGGVRTSRLLTAMLGGAQPFWRQVSAAAARVP